MAEREERQAPPSSACLLRQAVQGGLGRLAVVGHHKQNGAAGFLHNGLLQLGKLRGEVPLAGVLLVGYPGFQGLTGVGSLLLCGKDQHGDLLRGGTGGGIDRSRFRLGLQAIEAGDQIGVQRLQGLGKGAGVQQGLGGGIGVVCPGGAPPPEQAARIRVNASATQRENSFFIIDTPYASVPSACPWPAR